MLSRRVPAKINLDLRIAPPRPDGFHPLSSWFVTVGLFDAIDFDTYPLPGIHLSCDDPALAIDGSNLVVRAASDLLLSLPTAHPARETGLSLHLRKRIPTGGGLGGGSADAAHTLLGLVDLLNLRLEPGHLDRLAAKLGSDVNFFLHAPSALCTGRGEVIDPVPPPAAESALLILPTHIRMPTPAVYREFDRQNLGSSLPSRPASVQNLTSLARLPAEELMSRLHNDLEPAAFTLAPQLHDIFVRVQTHLHRTLRMSGSGSTLFALYDTLQEAQAAEASWDLTDAQAVAVSLCPDPHA